MSEESIFSSTLPVEVYQYLPGLHPSQWQLIDHGPGIFRIPPSQQAAVRIRTIDDEVLRTLISEILSCPAVTFLNLSENRRVTNRGINELSHLTQLTGLNVSSCDISDAALADLAKLDRLVWLNLAFCNRLTDRGLRELSRLTHLEYLDLQGCVKITRKGIALINRRGLTIKP